MQVKRHGYVAVDAVAVERIELLVELHIDVVGVGGVDQQVFRACLVHLPDAVVVIFAGIGVDADHRGVPQQRVEWSRGIVARHGEVIAVLPVVGDFALEGDEPV